MYGLNELELEKIAYLTCRGGWSTACLQQGEIALDRAFDYYDAVINEDITGADGINRSTERAKFLMCSYARNQGAQISIDEIRKDMIANDTNFFDAKTVQSYIDTLKKIFVMEYMLSLSGHLKIR